MIRSNATRGEDADQGQGRLPVKIINENYLYGPNTALLMPGISPGVYNQTQLRTTEDSSSVMEIALASLGCSHNQNIQYTGIAEYFFTSVKNDCIAPSCDHPRAVVSRAQCTVRTFHWGEVKDQ